MGLPHPLSPPDELPHRFISLHSLPYLDARAIMERIFQCLTRGPLGNKRRGVTRFQFCCVLRERDDTFNVRESTASVE